MTKPVRLSDKKVAEAANMSLTAFRARNASFQQKLREDVEAANRREDDEYAGISNDYPAWAQK